MKDWNIKIYRGILTGYNDAFIIDGAKKSELITADPKSAEIIRPILRGRDIKRYSFEHNDLWLIYVPWHFPLQNNNIQGVSNETEDLFKQQYPAVYNHLLSYKEALLNRNKAETGIRYEWYALQRWGANYTDDFSKQKIIWGEISDRPKFTMDKDGDYFIEATTFMMTGNHLQYLLLILNSKLSEYFFSKLGTTTGVGTVRWKKFKLEEFPIPFSEDIHPELLNKLYKYNQEIITDVELLSIDKIIYEIYCLTDEEINYIDNIIQ